MDQSTDQRIDELVSEWIIPTGSSGTTTTILLMTCHDLARRLHELQPDLSPVDVARLSLMILSQSDDMTRLSDDAVLMSVWKNASFRLEAASDQHAAVAEELDAICGNGPVKFSPDQLWVLLRAVKVQSQILELYTDEPALA